MLGTNVIKLLKKKEINDGKCQISYNFSEIKGNDEDFRDYANFLLFFCEVHLIYCITIQ